MKKNYAAVVLLSLVTTPLILFMILVGSRAADKAGSEAYAREAERGQRARAGCTTPLCIDLSYATSGEGPEYQYESGWPYPFMTGSGNSLSRGSSIEPLGLLVDAGIFFLLSLVFWLILTEVIFAVRARRPNPKV